MTVSFHLSPEQEQLKLGARQFAEEHLRPLAAEVRKLLDPKLGIQEVLIASTHNHEGPDTLGLWGKTAFSSGVDPGVVTSVATAGAGAALSRPFLLTIRGAMMARSTLAANVPTRARGSTPAKPVRRPADRARRCPRSGPGHRQPR